MLHLPTHIAQIVLRWLGASLLVELEVGAETSSTFKERRFVVVLSMALLTVFICRCVITRLNCAASGCELDITCSKAKTCLQGSQPATHAETIPSLC